MVVESFREELKSSATPARLWKAVVDSHNLLPKIAPQFIASFEIIEGDGGVGTVKLMTVDPAIKALSSVKTRIDAIDESKFYLKYSVLDGKDEKYESYTCAYNLEPCQDGGSLCNISGEYKTVGDYVPTEEERNYRKDPPMKTFKAIEAYLQANPDAYA